MFLCKNQVIKSFRICFYDSFFINLQHAERIRTSFEANIPEVYKQIYICRTSLSGMDCLLRQKTVSSKRHQLRSKITTLTKEKEYYQKKIEEDNRKMKELLSNRDNLEKFAREQYLMKNSNEDIFIIIDK